MPNTYPTADIPLGSTSPKVLYNNAENFDYFSVSPLPRFTDRFGKLRKTIVGMESDFQDFLIQSGYVYIGADYIDGVPGLTFTARNQYTVRDGIAYRLAAGAPIPYVTTGTWATDQDKFVAFELDTILLSDLQNVFDPRKGAAIIGRGSQVVSSLSALRDLASDTPSKTAYVTGTTAATYVFVPGDSTTPDDGWANIVAADGGRWRRQNTVSQSDTTALDFAVQSYQRNTSHTGGTPGYVDSTVRIDHTVGPSVTNFEWAFTSVMNNGATVGENVAIYGQGNKVSTGPTWAGVMEARDKTNNNDPTSGLVGLEIDIFANGTDSNNNRVGIDVVGGKGVTTPGSQMAEIFTGIRVGPQNLDSNNARFRNGILLDGDMLSGITVSNTGPTSTFGIKDTGAKAVGLELRGTYSAAAIRMPAGSKLAFDSTGLVYFSETSGVLSLTGTYLTLNNSFNIPSSGNTATTASAGGVALPATSSGFIIIKIDGINKKIPFYPE